HHIQAVQNLRAVLSVCDVCFRLAKQRAAIFSPFWPSHGYSTPEKNDSSVELADRYDIFRIFWRAKWARINTFQIDLLGAGVFGAAHLVVLLRITLPCLMCDRNARAKHRGWHKDRYAHQVSVALCG